VEDDAEINNGDSGWMVGYSEVAVPWESSIDGLPKTMSELYSHLHEEAELRLEEAERDRLWLHHSESRCCSYVFLDFLIQDQSNLLRK
jgi:hypothetical protein